MRLRLLLALLVVGSVFVMPSARAQTDLEAARQAVAAATERLENHLEELEMVQRRGNDLTADFWLAQGELEALSGRIDASQAASDDVAAQRLLLLDDVRAVAVDRYVNRTLPIQWTDVQTPADRAAAEALADLVIGADQSVIDQLAALDDEYTRTRERLEAQLAAQLLLADDAARTQREVADEIERMAALRIEIDTELGALEAALADLEAAEQERLAAEERARLAEERRQAEEAAAAAAAVARPAPTATVVPTALPAPTASVVPNPTPSEPLAAPTTSAVPNPTPSEPLAAPTTSAVPNPTPSEPFPTPTTSAVPNPTPSEPFPTPTTSAAPNPTPSQPLPPAGPVSSGGGIVCPLSGPFTHIDDFHQPRAVGGTHRANDLISAAGTPVLAVASGTVQHKNSSVGGLSAHLRGDNGDYYFYTHLSAYENEGAGHVAAGTVIGYVGETGNAPIPHLHFEIHSGGYGNYTNPYPVVRAACGT